MSDDSMLDVENSLVPQYYVSTSYSFHECWILFSLKIQNIKWSLS